MRRKPNSSRKKSPQLAELAAAEALGALNASERKTFDRLLARASAAEKALVDEHREAAALLAYAAPPAQPPASLRERVLTAVKAKTPAPEPMAHLRPGFYSLVDSEAGFVPTGVPGVVKKTLTINREQNYVVLLVRMAAGASFPSHDHGEAEECYVLAGDIQLEGRTLHAGDFHHAEKATRHSPASTVGGCTVLLIGSAQDYA